ncbi:TRAP transporter small permease [Clostridiisalibacter paucivorans]|uniref:TRAP transporter small permease n=1 Tax=Clostridiisalibacter paucivorans TaxID=408753 RepID=UPI0004798FF2|nr:TRAP transporter small permease [Clostridiisalibacter paucivorans]
MIKANKILDKMTLIIKWVSSILLTFMLVITFVQVVLRYVFNNPTMWSEEVTLLMLIWFGYLAISLAVREDCHISIESFYLSCKKGTRTIFDLIRHILMLGFSGLMIYYGIELMKISKGKYLPASHISRTLMYMAMAVAGVLMVMFTIVHILKIFISQEESEVK